MAITLVKVSSWCLLLGGGGGSSSVELNGGAGSWCLSKQFLDLVWLVALVAYFVFSDSILRRRAYFTRDDAH